MNKRCFAAIMGILAFMTASSQTLFTYGPYKADAADFVRTYNKNNSQATGNKAQAMLSYLDLYINSKLKVREAYERRMDTLPAIRTEINNLRLQLANNYMTDPAIGEKLTDEAFQRSLKDIHVAHIFIAFKTGNNPVDTAAAQRKLEEVLPLLKDRNFLQLAQQYSDDPSVKTNKGDIGYITLFTLPYELETAVYNTPAGKYSAPIKSRIGYHIFMNMGERKAIGKISIQQILLGIPPGADDAEKKQLAARADSLYKRIQAGDNFMKLASAFSTDYVSAATGGSIPDIGVGKYDPAFEKVLWALPKDGAVSKPVLTSHGWHIVKRVALKPVITDPNNKDNRQRLLQEVMRDSRWRLSSDFVYDLVKQKAGFKRYPVNEAALWAVSDSVLDLKPMTEPGRTIIATTPIFSIGDKIYDATAWVNYANIYRYKQDGTGAKPHAQVLDEFIKFSLVTYYRDHLEDFSSDFRNQMTEFVDGNLFFEIMQQEVWNKAQSDSVYLQALYETNKSKYTWKQSADAVLFFCADESTAKTVYEEIKKDPAGWRSVTDRYSEKVIIDSSRYEWEQIAGLGKSLPVAGMVTKPVLNPQDNTAAFAYIANVYPQPTQRSFAEARGMVLNDYQDQLEKQWVEQLRKKYPVVIDQQVFDSISK